MEPTTVIEAHDLVRQFAPSRGVCGVSLSIPRGETYALLGRNGSGKTTLTRLLVALARPAAGRLTVLGCRLDAGDRSHLRRCGAALDRSVHWPALTGRQNAAFVARSYGMSAPEVAASLTELLRIADLADRADDPVATYSFGMRRKLSIVEALCHEPELLVLDEPTAGVDAHFLSRLARLIRRRSEAGRTTWLASNDPDFCADVATRVAFMDDGRIVAEGTTEQLLAELAPTREVRVRLRGPADLPAPPLAGVRAFRQDDHEVTAVLDDDRELVGGLIQWIVSTGAELRAVDVRHSTLRDAFLLRTGKTIDAAGPPRGGRP